MTHATGVSSRRRAHRRRDASCSRSTRWWRGSGLAMQLVISASGIYPSTGTVLSQLGPATCWAAGPCRACSTSSRVSRSGATSSSRWCSRCWRASRLGDTRGSACCSSTRCSRSPSPASCTPWCSRPTRSSRAGTSRQRPVAHHHAGADRARVVDRRPRGGIAWPTIAKSLVIPIVWVVCTLPRGAVISALPVPVRRRREAGLRPGDAQHPRRRRARRRDRRDPQGIDALLGGCGAAGARVRPRPTARGRGPPRRGRRPGRARRGSRRAVRRGTTRSPPTVVGTRGRDALLLVQRVEPVAVDPAHHDGTRIPRQRGVGAPPPQPRSHVVMASVSATYCPRRSGRELVGVVVEVGLHGVSPVAQGSSPSRQGRRSATASSNSLR